MRTKIFFRASSGSDYELVIEHDVAAYIPGLIVEDQSGLIQDMTSDRSWSSIAEMTHDLKAEITSWGSDIGD